MDAYVQSLLLKVGMVELRSTVLLNLLIQSWELIQTCKDKSGCLPLIFSLEGCFLNYIRATLRKNLKDIFRNFIPTKNLELRMTVIHLPNVFKPFWTLKNIYQIC